MACMHLYIATSNPGKVRDFREAATAAGYVLEPLPGLASMPEPVEDAATFAGNADIKAVAFSLLAPGLLVLADDSGLEVDALGGRPGVLSARFAATVGYAPRGSAPASKDARNIACLLSMLREVERAGGGDLSRGARFVCALALARDGQVLLRAEGAVEGEIVVPPRGTGGFGYDPIFAIRQRGLTLAELPPAEKWSLSHRGNAFRDLVTQLRNFDLEERSGMPSRSPAGPVA